VSDQTPNTQDTIPADIRIGSNWMPEDLLPWLPSAIFVMSRMVLENVMPLNKDTANLFGENFFLGAEILAQTFKAAKVSPMAVEHGLSDMVITE
jgi:hypothetical protein